MLANSAARGRLGLFVGTGFSIAATNGVALTFEGLLQSVAVNLALDTDFSSVNLRLKSLPQIASALILELSHQKGISLYDAGVKFRSEIARICNLIPDESAKPEFDQGLNTAGPSWIVTTNYDLILESLIDRSESVLPTEALFPNMERVPIYHLHGHRHYQDSIKVTEEDYVGLLAPLDYQRLKLPLLFAESTTLMLGYALGDINVRAAMEWAKSFQSQARLPGSPNLHGKVILALYHPTPSPEPIIGEQGEIILETSNVAALLIEIGKWRHDVETVTRMWEDEVRKFLADGTNALAIEKEGPEREELLKLIRSSGSMGATGAVIQFLQMAIQPIWKKAREDDGFEYYDTYLEILVALIRGLKITDASPVIMYFIADSLNNVGYYFNERFPIATAHQATRRWLREAPTLDAELLNELASFSAAHDMVGLNNLLTCSALRR